MFRILHLSDLHASEKTTWSTTPILKEAKSTILLQANKQNIDVVAFTGDIAFSGKKEEYAIAQAWLDDLCLKPTGLNMERGQLLLVPGNHDVDRSMILPAATAIEDKLTTAKSEAMVAQFYDDDDSKRLLFKRHSAYSEFCTSFLGIDVASTLCWSRVFKTGLGRIRIDGLNTSWLCRGDSDHRKLLVGQSQLTEVMKEHGDAELRVTLMHHPLADLMEFDEVNTSDYLRQNTDVLLRGHLHRAETSLQITNTGGFLEIAAGALHDTHESPNRFSILDISDDLSEIRISTFCWQSGRWILDRNLYQTADGIGIYRLKKPIEPNAELKTSASLMGVKVATDTQDQRGSVDSNMQSNVPRFQHIPTSQDLAIRERQLDDAVTRLRSSRRLVIQKEPGAKYEGFLACIIRELKPPGIDTPPPALHFRCTGVTDGKELQNTLELASGSPITVFGNSLRESGECVLIFDDLDFAISESQSDGPTIEGTLEALHDFCPNLSIIRVSALSCPAETNSIRIGRLDVADTRSYMINAARPVQLSSATDYARVHRITGGIPVYLDDFINALGVADLEGALAQIAGQPITSTNSLHESTVKEIQELQNTTIDELRRTRSLLWTLAILEQGESLTAIKRLDGQAPIWPRNATYLQNKGCLESVSITSRFGGASYGVGVMEGDKILRIPRLVRDYVLSIMPQAEREEITRKVATLYFSDDWRHGTVRMRRRLSIGNEISTHQSGNELAILKCLLLAPTIYFGSSVSAAFQLPLSYISQLQSKGLYGEAYEATKDTLAIVESMQDMYSNENVYEIRLAAASCARIVGEWDMCVQYLTAALPDVRASGVKATLTNALVDHALALRSLDRDKEANESAEEILKIAPKNSADYLQAKAIQAQINMSRADAIRYLKPLATKARNYGFHTVADNAILWMVSDTDNSEEKLKLLGQVKSRRELGLNFVRATIYRVETLLDMGRISELTLTDRNDITASYQLAYSQRLSLFNWCHRVFWRYLIATDNRKMLTELYIYSSFVWRLNGDSTNELSYSTQLQKETSENRSAFETTSIIGYLVRRITALTGWRANVQ